MATREELDILIKAQDQTRAAFESAQRNSEKLSSQVDSLIDKTQVTEAATSKATTAVLAFGAVASAAAVAVGALATGFAKSLGELLDYTESLEKANLSTGVSTELWQKLIKTGDEMDISFDSIRGAVERMEKSLEGNGEALRKFGIDVESFAKLDADEKFRAMAVQIMAIEDPSTRAAAAIAAFGRGGAELIPLLAKVVDGAVDMQRVLGTDTVEGLNRTKQAIDGAKTAWKGFEQSLVATVALNLKIDTFFNSFADGLRMIEEKGGVFKMVAADWVGAAQLLATGNLAVAVASREAYLAIGRQEKQTRATSTAVLEMTETQRRLRVGLDELVEMWEKEEKANEKATKALNAWERGLQNAEEAARKNAMATEAALLKTWNDLDAAAAAHARYMMELDEQEQKAAQAAVDAQIRAEEQLTARMNAEEARRLADAERAAEQKREAIGRLINEVGVLFEQLGVSADSNLGKAIGGFQDMGNAALGVQDVMTQLAQGNLWGAIAAGVGVVSMAVSGLKKLWDSIFGKSEIEKINDTRDAFISAHGGWLALQQEIAQATDEDLLKKLFDADTVEEYEAAIREIEEALAKLSATKVDPIHVPVVYDDPGYESGGGGGGGEYAPGMARGGVVLPFVPRAAQGIVTAHSPNGQLIRAGEKEAELVAPVRAILENAARIGAAAAGRQAIEMHVYLDGREIFASVENRYRAGGGSPKRRG